MSDKGKQIAAGAVGATALKGAAIVAGVKGGAGLAVAGSAVAIPAAAVAAAPLVAGAIGGIAIYKGIKWLFSK